MLKLLMSHPSGVLGTERASISSGQSCHFANATRNVLEGINPPPEQCS